MKNSSDYKQKYFSGLAAQAASSSGKVPLGSRIFQWMVCILLVIIAACAPTEEGLPDAAPTREADLQRIDRLREEFLVLNRAKDAAGVANLHADDVVLMAPNSEAVVGRDALQALLQRSYDSPDETSVDFSSEEVEVLGEWAFARGTYVQTGPADSGKYLQILKRQPDGSWKYARNMWSGDHPDSGGCD